MYLSEEAPKTSTPSISSSHIFTGAMCLIVLGLVGLIVFESIRLTHKPTIAFNKFLTVADLSGYDKCIKNKGGNGCKVHLLKQWEKINDN